MGTQAAPRGFTAQRFDTGDYVLLGWLRAAKPGGRGTTLHVYIEGDGRAWISRTRASSDPTPTSPVGFELAAADPTPDAVLYLARPCQYTEGSDFAGCSKADWTSARFSPRVLRSMNRAVEEAMRRVGATKVAVYGFSGGGAIAALLAEEREDVVFLGTVAGNLDHAAWTAHHRVSPLNDSLNPKSRAGRTAGIPQLHLSGGADDIMPAFIAEAWCRAISEAACARRVQPGIGHEGPWAASWARALREVRADF